MTIGSTGSKEKGQKKPLFCSVIYCGKQDKMYRLLDYSYIFNIGYNDIITTFWYIVNTVVETELSYPLTN